jgi:hypothetical protein
MIVEFPRLVYKSAEKYKLARSVGEFNEFLEDGWCESVADAVSGIVAKPSAKSEKKSGWGSASK